MAKTKKTGGVSLAKGPVALIGLVLLAYGITAFILGGHSFALHPLSGTVQGKTWLGLEVNAWSSLLFVGAGLLLLFGSPVHALAKSLSLIVGLVLGAASVIALYDKQDVFGIFAANGLTKLVWGVAGALLILLSLLPRVGRKPAPGPAPSRREDPEVRETRREPVRSEPVRDASRFEREERIEEPVGQRSTGSRVVAPAEGTTPESRETTRRQRENGEF
jgi:hypothetical protein